MGYLSNFIVYLLAMIGLMMLAVFIFKNCTSKINNTNGKNINIIDSVSIGARKNLLIASVGNEKFLIASDADRTSLISKLENEKISESKLSELISLEYDDHKTRSFADRDLIQLNRNNILDNQKKSYNSVMRNIAEKMRG